MLRTYPTDIDRDVKPRDSVIRELIEIGKPAVPKLTAELDRTEEPMLSDLAFVLRAIGDPRAAPPSSAPFRAWRIRRDRPTGFSLKATRTSSNSGVSTI